VGVGEYGRFQEVGMRVFVTIQVKYLAGFRVFLVVLSKNFNGGIAI